MKYLFTTAVLITAFTLPAQAAGTHVGGHGANHNEAIVHGHDEEQAHGHGENGHHDQMAIGTPGDLDAVSKTISITMLEKEDGSMAFEPATIAVTKGETVRLSFANNGDADHEFVMDTHKGIVEHKVAMEKWPNMEHADPNSIHLESGKSGEIIWTFNKDGNFQFACLIPGHFDAGMHGKLTVASN